MTTPPLPLDEIVAQIPSDKRAAAIALLASLMLTEPPVVERDYHGNGVEPDTTLDVPAIAQMLKKSPRWVWRNQKKLPLRRVGRGLIASRRELETWLARQRVK